MRWRTGSLESKVFAVSHSLLSALRSSLSAALLDSRFRRCQNVPLDARLAGLADAFCIERAGTSAFGISIEVCCDRHPPSLSSGTRSGVSFVTRRSPCTSAGNRGNL